MIDIHSHILYCLDDGSKSISESISMAKEAFEAGITDIICTPHNNESYYSPSMEQIAATMFSFQKELDKQNCPIKLHVGNEVYLDDTVENKITSNSLYSLANSRYILIELPVNTEYVFLDQLIFSIKNLGKTPILAHPERYMYLQNEKNKIYKYIDMGLILQCNFGSILNMYGPKAKNLFKFLLKEHLVSFIASDAHHSNSIYYNLESAKQKIFKKISKSEFDTITNINPQKILLDQDIF